MNPDIGNALFFLAGAGLMAYDCLTLYRHKQLRGLFWPSRAFWISWEIWTVYYYIALNQPWSFAASFVYLLFNITWAIMAWHYRKN